MSRHRKASHFIDVPNITDPKGFVCLMQRYLEYLRVRNYSPRTVETRQFYLTQFINWSAQRDLLRPTEISKPILDRYQRHLFHYRQLNGKPLSFSSQHGHLVSIRGWFKWLTRENHILYNPASDIELPKLPQRLPKAVLSVSEAEAILNQPDVNQLLGLRDRAILETFYSTGIRRLEMLQLTLADVDAERGTLMIRQGKGAKDRMIPIGARAIAWIEKYLIKVRPNYACGRDQGYLFLTLLGEPFSPRGLSKMVHNHVKAAEIGKSGSCHLFRHTMATLMLENGADIRYIQAMLGHVDIKTTQIYTRVSIKKLKQIHTLTHPAKDHRTQSVDWDEDPDASVVELLTTLDAEAVEEQE